MTYFTDSKKQLLWQRRRAENLLASLQLTGTELELGTPNPGLSHLCSLHKALYGEALDDAGKLRQVNIELNDVPCCHYEYLEQQGNELMNLLEEEPLGQLPKNKLIKWLSWFYTELSVLSPFRCGNARTLRLFFEQLIIHAGFDVRWGKVSAQHWNRALANSVSGQSEEMEVVFGKVVSVPK